MRAELTNAFKESDDGFISHLLLLPWNLLVNWRCIANGLARVDSYREPQQYATDKRVPRQGEW